MRNKKFHRRSIRIPGGNYTQGGGYFVTICASNRRSIFGEIEGGRAILTPLGEIVRRCWMEIPRHFPRATLKEFVVMPNHVHGIIVLGAAQPGEETTAESSAVGAREASGLQSSPVRALTEGPDVPSSPVGARYIVPLHHQAPTPEKFQKPVRGSIPTIIRTFKAEVTRGAGRELAVTNGAIWQRNYFERVLRNGQEYADASRYIMENPMRWEDDEENPRRKPGPDRDSGLTVGAR